MAFEAIKDLIRALTKRVVKLESYLFDNALKVANAVVTTLNASSITASGKVTAGGNIETDEDIVADALVAYRGNLNASTTVASYGNGIFYGNANVGFPNNYDITLNVINGSDRSMQLAVTKPNTAKGGGSFAYLRSVSNGDWGPWSTISCWGPWITSGLSFSTSSDWSIVQYEVRSDGTKLQGQVIIQYSGSTITVGDKGNISDINGIVTFPSGYRPTSSLDLRLTFYHNGYPSWHGRIKADGTVDLAAGSAPGDTLASGDQLTLPIDYFID